MKLMFMINALLYYISVVLCIIKEPALLDIQYSILVIATSGDICVFKPPSCGLEHHAPLSQGAF